MASETVRVNLHCHSTLSDGIFPPEELARILADDGVFCASLTDHDTCEGSARFRQALSRRGIGCIDGVEITAQSAQGEIHLLAYGIDPLDPGLHASLAEERHRSDQGMRGLVDTVKRVGARGRAPRPGALSAAEAIRLAHAAGGAVFLAHPLSYGLDSRGLDSLLDELSAAGLDGLEAVYAPYAEPDRRMLAERARARGLAVSGGSDLHDTAIEGQSGGVELSRDEWRALRELLLRGRPSPSRPATARPSSSRRGRPGRFALGIVAPTVLAIALFVVSLFALILPRFEAILLERKKEMIRELTNSVVSILAEYAAEEQAGRTTLQKAQDDAAARIRDIRYGKEGKDYFWITDMRPSMVMHPYRPDLVGTEVGWYADANGVRVFVEFVNAVREKREGYVEYLWQWEDDAHRIVPKLSFVKRFPPWDWVVGTGIYLDDVRAEIDAMVRRLIGLSIGIGVALALLLAFVVQQGLAIERGRSAAEAGLRESSERYRALVQASTEGMVMLSGGACTYANATFLDMLGFTEAEIPLHSLADLVDPGDLADPDRAGFHRRRVFRRPRVADSAAALRVPPGREEWQARRHPACRPAFRPRRQEGMDRHGAGPRGRQAGRGPPGPCRGAVGVTHRRNGQGDDPGSLGKAGASGGGKPRCPRDPRHPGRRGHRADESFRAPGRNPGDRAAGRRAGREPVRYRLADHPLPRGRRDPRDLPVGGARARRAGRGAPGGVDRGYHRPRPGREPARRAHGGDAGLLARAERARGDPRPAGRELPHEHPGARGCPADEQARRGRAPCQGAVRGGAGHRHGPGRARAAGRAGPRPRRSRARDHERAAGVHPGHGPALRGAPAHARQ